MQTMATSAGAADKEMEIITQSLSYKLNALAETGTGIFQNLFQREDMGAVIDMLTGVLSVLDAFTEKFGLMGTVLASGAIAMGIINIASAIRQLHAEGQVVTSIGLLTKLFPKLEDGILNAYTSGQGLLGVLSAMAPVLVPLGIAIGAVTAAFAGFKAFDYKNSGWTRSQEAASKAVDDYQKAQDKLKSLEDTQTSNLESAKEIAAKYNIDVEGVETVDEVIAKIEASDTGITLVDEAELHKLSNANTDLETQIRLQRQLANTQKKTMETATEESAKAQKSFWEVVKERHSGGFFGTIAAGWDYIKSNFGGHSTFIDDEGNEHIYKSEGDRWREIGGAAGATNLELAKNAFEEYKKAKQDLETLDNQLLAQDEDATQNQLATRKQLVDNLQEKTESMTGYMDTLTQQTETLASVDSDFARDQVKQARQLFLDFENFGLSKPEAALNSLTHFFDGSAGTNAIKDTLREAAEEGKNLEDVLASMGLTLEDLNLGKDGLEYLNKYFADASKSAQEAKETIDDFRVSASDVEEATKSANRDKDWTTIQAAYKSAKELLAEGKTGVDDFQTVAQFFSPKNLGLLAQKAKDAGGYASDVYQQAFEDAQAKADRWFGENEAQSLMNFADDMQSKGMFTIDKSDEKGLWDIQSNFKNTAEAANEMGISVQAVEALLSGLEAYGYDFSGIQKSGELIEQYATSLDALKVAYDQMEEGAAKDRLGGLIQQFDDEYAKLGEDLSNLSEDQIIRLKFEYDLATLQNDITDLQNNINNGDNSVSNYAGLISLNDKYIQKSKEELGNVELPVEYKISEEAEAQLKEQLPGKNGEEKLELQAEITNQQEIQKGILDELNAEKPIIEPEVNSDKVKEEVNSATEDAEATVTANVEGKEEVEELNESKEKAGKDENANVSVSTSGEGEVQSLADNAEKAGSDKTGTVTVETEGEDKVEELADSTEKATNGNTINLSINIAGKEDYDSIVDKDVAINANVEVSGKDEYDSVSDKSVTISANVQMTGGDDKVADKKATVKYSKDSSVADSYQPSDKEATVKYGKDSSIPDGYQPSDKYATVHYSANTSGLPNSFPTITRYVNYVKTGAVSVDGTAHVDGTAFASGNWGTKSDGVALGGELGRKHFASVHGDMCEKLFI